MFPRDHNQQQGQLRRDLGFFSIVDMSRGVELITFHVVDGKVEVDSQVEEHHEREDDAKMLPVKQKSGMVTRKNGITM